MTPDFTKIPNDFLEILMSKEVNHSEARILLYVARKTYGLQKDSDRISLSQFQKILGLSRPTITEALLRLVKSGLLVKKQGQKRVPNSWSINEKYNTPTDKPTDAKIINPFIFDVSEDDTTTDESTDESTALRDLKNLLQQNLRGVVI